MKAIYWLIVLALAVFLYFEGWGMLALMVGAIAALFAVTALLRGGARAGGATFKELSKGIGGEMASSRPKGPSGEVVKETFEGVGATLGKFITPPRDERVKPELHRVRAAKGTQSFFEGLKKIFRF